jgi:hypothetical protein
VAAAVIIAAALLAYGNSLHGDFVFDDKANISENDYIKRPETLWEGLPLHADVFRRSLAINYRLGGLDPWGYHLFNLAVHVLAALVLLGIVRRTLLSQPLRERFGRHAAALALAVALLWTVHPLQTESVTYLVQRRESMMGLCLLLTLYTVIRGTASRLWPAWYAAAIFFCWLGMGVKAVMVVAPIVVFLYDRTFLAGSFLGTIRRRWPLYLALLATWWDILPWGHARLLESGMGVQGTDITTVSYLRSQFAVVTHYLRLCFWPTGLCLDYDWPVAKTWTEVLPQVILIAALVGLTLWALWRRPAEGFPGVWFFGILAPTSSFVTISFLAFEHRMYLSLAGVAAFVVCGGYVAISYLLRRRVASDALRRRAGWAAGLVLVAAAAAALGYLTACRNLDYRTDLVMWSDIAAKAPTNPRAHYTLGNIFSRRGRNQEAVAKYRQAIYLKPDYVEAYNNLGSLYLSLDRPRDAEIEFRMALRTNPDSAEVLSNLGVAIWIQGRRNEAISCIREALRISPNYASAQKNLLLVLSSPSGTGRRPQLQQHQIHR